MQSASHPVSKRVIIISNSPGTFPLRYLRAKLFKMSLIFLIFLHTWLNQRGSLSEVLGLRLSGRQKTWGNSRRRYRGASSEVVHSPIRKCWTPPPPHSTCPPSLPVEPWEKEGLVMSTMELFCWRSDPEHLMRDSSLRLYLIRSFALFVFMWFSFPVVSHIPSFLPSTLPPAVLHHHPCNLRLSPSDNGSAPRGGN